MKPSLRLQRPWVAMTALMATSVNVDSCSATLKEFDGCEHSSECVDNYWKMIWAIITLATIIYFILLAWTCWISSKSSRVISHKSPLHLETPSVE